MFRTIAKGIINYLIQLKAGTSNFTSNIGTLLSIPNNVLQGNFEQLGHSVGSFVVNSSVGILGIFNPAEKMGLKPHKEDVGQTLRYLRMWSWLLFCASILGPTTVRDSLGCLLTHL